jgi:hypothetical protein
MAVQVGAFRHALEEVAQRERLWAGALQRLRGALRAKSLLVLLGCRRERKCREKDSAACRGKDSKSAHQISDGPR